MPFLIRAMGHRAFRRYGLSGERIVAAEALRLGLVHQVCDAAGLEDTVGRIADELLHGAPGAIAALKEAAAPFASPPLSAILARHMPHNPKTPEAIEGIASFREKRKPSWYPE
jgi:methylglutaconyl-CoA hydratase